MPQLRPVPPVLRRALQFFVSHGLVRGVKLLLSRATAPLQGRARTPHLATPFDLYPRHAPPATHPFDLLYGVDTSGFHHGEDLGPSQTQTCVPAADASLPLRATLWNTAYYGIAPSVFDRAMALIAPSEPPDWSRFTFVDLGCGKGRALLLASRFPFRHILGVELDATLAGIAETNLRTFHAPWQQSRSLEARHGDATTFDLPPTPTLLYLYHPFLAPILKRVLRRVEQSLQRQPRELWLVYINPEADHVLRGFPFLREVTRVTLALEPEDALPDRLGSTKEEVAIFHVNPVDAVWM